MDYYLEIEIGGKIVKERYDKKYVRLGVELLAVYSVVFYLIFIIISCQQNVTGSFILYLIIRGFTCHLNFL